MSFSPLPQGAPEVKLIPVFFFNLKISPDPQQIYRDASKDKALALATVTDGQIVPLKNELGLEFSLSSITGFDDITETLSLGVSKLDCKLYGKTKQGSGVYITYPGLIKLVESTVKVLTKESSTSDFEDTYVTCNPSFTFDSTIEAEYKWIAKENFVGKGRFARDEQGTLHVQYYTYVIR